MQVLAPSTRWPNMRFVRTEGTRPERAVRAALLCLGQRFECNVEGLPGTPDIVLSGKRAIFVHGCIWHGHDCKRGIVFGPDTASWRLAQAKNMARDRETYSLLADRQQWRLFVIWECETRDFENLKARLKSFLEG